MILSVSLTIAMALLVWFKTQALQEYLNLFHLTFTKRWVKLDEYEKMVKAPGVDLSYIEFLKEHCDCFFVRLVTCPICVSVWLGLLSAHWTGIGCIAAGFLGLFFFHLAIKMGA